VERYFAGFSYSTELSQGEGSPLAHFLSVRRGHCQLFATAAAVLLRSAGLPARYVVGYYANPPPEGHQLILREWDAHAWAEVAMPGRGWMRVDATPPDFRGAAGRRSSIWQRVLDLWGLAEYRWLRTVVDYDARSQVESFQWVRRLLRPRLLGTGLWIIAGLILAWGLIFLLRTKTARTDIPLRLERKCFRILNRLAPERRPAETVQEALARMARLGPRAAQAAWAAEPLLARLEAARFGDHPLRPGDINDINQGISALRRRFQDVT
jgi:hypothetical protein